MFFENSIKQKKKRKKERNIVLVSKLMQDQTYQIWHISKSNYSLLVGKRLKAGFIDSVTKI